MMELSLQAFIDLFESDQTTLNENFNEVKITIIASRYNDLDAYALENSLIILNSRDDLHLSVVIGESDPIDHYSPNSVQAFLLELNTAMGQRDDEQILITLIINKKQVSGCISIYAFEKFFSFLNKLSLQNLLSQFNLFLKQTGFIVLENQLENKTAKSKSIWLVNKGTTNRPEATERIRILELAKIAGYSNFLTEYNLLPEDFILEESGRKTELEKFFNRLAIVASVAFLFDVLSISESKLTYKLNGYKTIQGSLEFIDIRSDLSQQYEKIYQWVYNSGNFNDKLGLAKNIISLHLNSVDNLKLNGFPYDSLYSAYKIYEKENIAQYISVRNSLSDQLLNFHDKANALAESFGESLQKSALALISFYISIIVLKVVNKDHLHNVFTFDVSIFSTVILICSYLYFLSSKWDLGQQKTRLANHYFDLKRRYTDLLSRQDIDRILDNDREHLQDIDFINAKLRRFSGLWISFLAIMLFSTWFLFFLEK